MKITIDERDSYLATIAALRAEVERLKKPPTTNVLYQHELDRMLKISEARVAELEAALGELIEVSDLRGDIDEIPHPCDDPKLWTARLIQAWDDARQALRGEVE